MKNKSLSILFGFFVLGLGLGTWIQNTSHTPDSSSPSAMNHPNERPNKNPEEQRKPATFIPKAPTPVFQAPVRTPSQVRTPPKKSGSDSLPEGSYSRAAEALIQRSNRVEFFEFPPNDKGEFKRITVYERTEPNKHPFFRVVEIRKLDSTSPSGSVEVSRSLSIADHFLLKLKPGASREHLQAALTKNGFQILEHKPSSDVYLITPQHRATIEAIESGLEKLGAEPFVKFTSPNHIIFAM